MTDHDATDIDQLRRSNRTLEKKLARAEGRVATLEQFRESSDKLMRGLMTELNVEKAESERLLLNILPETIAQRLKEEPGVIADSFESVSVLFADVVGFTPLSESLSAQEVVEWLNDVYSEVDGLVQEHGVEKIRTIGDGYMVASGVPHIRDDHAVALTRLAIDMKEHFSNVRPVHGNHVDFRIGISSGPVVGGVIGTHKFQYDIWGDTVNTAARMESHGVPGRIHISGATYGLIKDSFATEPRGAIEVKGKGLMETWFVEGQTPQS
jgi:class 3 adenylate cyclase